MSYDEVKTQTLTGTSVWTPSVQGPVDGYRAYAETVNTGFQTLINNDIYLSNRTSRISNLQGESDSLCTLYADIASCFGDNDVDNVYEIIGHNTNADKVPPRVYAQMSDDSPLWFQCPWFPEFSIIKDVYFSLLCPSASVLPTNMPVFDIIRYQSSTDVMTTVGTVTDASSSLIVFNGIHTASAEDINITVQSDEYFIKFHKDISYPGVYITSLRFHLVSGE